MIYEKPPTNPSDIPTFNSDASFIMLPDYWIRDFAAFQSVNNPTLFLHIPSVALEQEPPLGQRIAPPSSTPVQLKIEVYGSSSEYEAAASFLVTARPDPWPPVAT
jgi:hypothetical protein